MVEEEIRKRVKSLKSLYMDVLWYILGSALFTLLWFIFDRNEIFWPKYIMLIWSIALLIEMIRKKPSPLFQPTFSFSVPNGRKEKSKKCCSPIGSSIKLVSLVIERKRFKNTQGAQKITFQSV